MSTAALPAAFIWRRIHSLMGLWLVLFLSEHLLTNSQAALWIGDNGAGFVRMVDMIHNLPYLHVIELSLIGVPLLIHMVWGIKYALQGKMNSFRGNGTSPVIKTYRNRAYSWQRITSWFLLIFIIGHVVKFRFLEYPEQRKVEGQVHYIVSVSQDPRLPSLAEKLQVLLYEEKGEWFAESDKFGTATLLSVRDTFKNPFYVALYTLFVMAACFHAYNGFWTFLITWGWVLKMSAQRAWTLVSVCLIALFIFLGLSAVWGSYFFGGS